MKEKLVSLFNSVLAMVAAALGLSSCDGPFPAPMYGCPYDPYKMLDMSGYVVDEEGNPIEDIKVSLAKVTESTDGALDTVDLQSTKSKTDGDFSMYIRIDPYDSKYLLVATDVDGDANGSFETGVKTLELDNQQYQSTQRVTFVLREKPTASEPEDNGEDEQA